MKLPQIDWKETLGFLIDELKLMISTIKEKGAQFFLRPLAVGALMVGGSYYLIYLPPVGKLKRLDKKLVSARAIARFSSSYGELHQRLAVIYPQLPQSKDRADWLYKTIIASLKAKNVISDSLRPPSDDEQGGLIYQNTSVNSRLKFSEVRDWVIHLESIKPALQISSLEIVKIKEDIGYNKMSCSVDAVIPVKRY